MALAIFLPLQMLRLAFCSVALAHLLGSSMQKAKVRTNCFLSCAAEMTVWDRLRIEELFLELFCL